jgi:hypothetical protein
MAATWSAQDAFGKPADSSPAVGHAQVIAHGIATMPGGEMVWRVAAPRAAAPNRSLAAAQEAGFVLADAGVVALANGDGTLWQRIAPGEAAWTSPDSLWAVVSLAEQVKPYYDIALVPAASLSQADRATSGAPFDLPGGRAFDLVLVRDVLIRNEESDIAGTGAPGLLLVTSGMVTVASASGGAVDLAAGDVGEIDGDTVITATSRAPASFVIALVGPEVPQGVKLRDHQQPTVSPAQVATPTPIPTATPVPIPTPAATPTLAPVVLLPPSVTISSFIYPVEYEGSDYALDCVNPASGVEFSVTKDGATV